jgi:hypothetical protein
VSKPWIDHSLLKMINHKRQLWRNFRRSGAPSDYDIHRNFSNHLKNVINENKTKFENNLLNNPKAFYGHLRKHLSSRVSVPIVHNLGGILCLAASKLQTFWQGFLHQCLSPVQTITYPQLFILMSHTPTLCPMSYLRKK